MQNVVPGASLYPGAHANYEAGSIIVRALIWHYTVGTNSLDLIAREGLCAFLGSQDGTLWQTGPWDSRQYHACEWNDYTQGYEVESLDGSILPAQIATLGYWSLFMLQANGIVDTFYDGPRLPVGFPLTGISNHRCLHEYACAEHYDGFDQWVYDAWHVPAPAPIPEPDWFAQQVEEGMAQIKAFLVTLDQPGQKYAKAALMCEQDPVLGSCSHWVRSQTEFAAVQAAGALAPLAATVDQAILDEFPLRPGSYDPRDGKLCTVLTR